MLPQNIINNIPFYALAMIFITLAYWVPSFFLVYHMTRFGIGTRPKLIALVFMVGSVILFTFFIIMLSRFDLVGMIRQGPNYFNY